MMFRKPRSSFDLSSSSLSSLGRPPTPPSGEFATRTPHPRAPMPTPQSKTPQSSKSSTARLTKTPSSKGKAKPNASILSFFKKAEAEPEKAQESDEDHLFLRDDDDYVEPTKPVERPPLLSRHTSSDETRFNESACAVKRRRTSTENTVNEEINVTEAEENVGSKVEPLQELPFGNRQNGFNLQLGPELNKTGDSKVGLSESNTPSRTGSLFKKPPPPLKREPTSVSEDLFDGIEDFAEDEFPEDGEEFSERLFLQEQRALEREFEDDIDEEMIDDDVPTIENQEDTVNGEPDCSCPICNASLAGLSSEQASLHVNRCLDGDPLPVTRPAPKQSETIKQETTNSESASQPGHKRFQRAAIPRPPQENPFNFGDPSGGSAFSKIMSSHAEDQAWSTAAANELAARGKPAFKRTCPFYKILPGLFICVDAFRYGAVEGCNAYFLSHFHSDHYIGLTSSWCHGPIYCSRVTGNLVRQQLRVDPKWVVDLEFEEKREVPGTKGVQVTMIPANHCPGSSLFLFEKVIGKGQNPRMQRILHCGDFRACPAHVQHPLLRPDVVDAITGKKKEQRLDVCYLDTTYLTPKYAFPSQKQVITACADMCVSLSKEFIDENDSWEQTKKARAGSGMVKFVQAASKPPPAASSSTSSEVPPSIPPSPSEKPRGRLLVVVGTYSIGKERICLGIARALDSKIFAPPAKLRICRALEDPELNARLTGDPLEAQVHMQMLMEIRAETLADYLTGYSSHFSRVVGFRPSGWNYRPPKGRFIEAPSVGNVLRGENWRTQYSMRDLVPQRGSTRQAACYGVPYSEHSSFRELTLFCCALRIEKIIPTVNVGSAKSRERMKVWIDKWAAERRKNGLFEIEDGMTEWT